MQFNYGNDWLPFKFLCLLSQFIILNVILLLDSCTKLLMFQVSGRKFFYDLIDVKGCKNRINHQLSSCYDGLGNHLQKSSYLSCLMQLIMVWVLRTEEWSLLILKLNISFSKKKYLYLIFWRVNQNKILPYLLT